LLGGRFAALAGASLRSPALRCARQRFAALDGAGRREACVWRFSRENRLMMRFVVALAACLLGSVSHSRAQLPAAGPVRERREPTASELVYMYNLGLRLSLAPGIVVPVDGSRVGFSFGGDVRFGFPLGPTIVAPGLRVAGYWPEGFSSVIGLATLRVTVPLGPVGPYVLGGAGPGHVSKPSETGLAYQAGGGFMVYVGDVFGIGAEASYLAITGTDFRSLFIGPALLLGF
jgi:hypothetical protein